LQPQASDWAKRQPRQHHQSQQPHLHNPQLRHHHVIHYLHTLDFCVSIKDLWVNKASRISALHDSEEAPAKKKKKKTYAQSAAPAATDEESERPFIGYHADYGPAAKPAQLQHPLHRTSTQNVRYVTIGTRPGEASRHRRQRSNTSGRPAHSGVATII
jgi:hypothetical protein